MSPTLRWSTATAAFALVAVACVHVPDSIKAEFRAPEPDERSNYQPGLHGTAPPAEASDPWSRWGAGLATADAGSEDSGTAQVGALPSTDGGEERYPTPASVIRSDGGTTP